MNKVSAAIIGTCITFGFLYMAAYVIGAGFKGGSK